MKILICIPTIDEKLHYKLMFSIQRITNFFNNNNIKSTVKFKTGSLINRVRNECITTFLERPEFTHLLFIDSDVYDFEDTLIDMINSNCNVIGGAYRKKEDLEGYNFNLKYSINQSLLMGDVMEVNHVGTGLLLIKREVFNKIIFNYPDRKYFKKGVTYYNFFDSFIYQGNYLSEDYGFCHLYSELGGKIYCLLNSKVTHSGNKEYIGDLKKFLKNKI